MARLSETQQRDLLIALGLGDFLVGGKLTKAAKTALMASLRAIKPVAVSEAKGLTRLAARGVVGAARIAPRAVATVARTNPYALAATLAYAGYIHRDEIAEVGAAIADNPRTQAAYEDLLESGEAVVGRLREPFTQVRTVGGLGRPAGFPTKRRVSKANKAVKHAMGLLKAGAKASTGADKGKLPKGAFKIATKAAGLANPKTKSKPGKGKSIINKLARRLKKWW